MRVVCEDFVGDWVDHLAVIVLREMEFLEVGGFEGLAVDGVGAVLEEPG